MEPLPKKNEAHNGDDRLSNLPDAILHHILELSGLQIFDVVKLGVLSKRWNRLWITTPYFDIHVKGLPDDPTFPQKLINFINWVLIRQAQSTLVRFRLIPTVNIHELEILRWLRVVVERNVQEIDITFLPSGEFRLPLFVAVNDSLRLLKITLRIRVTYDSSGVTIFNNVMQLPSVVRLNQLTSLELNNVVFSDSDMLQRLFSGCCSLESLRLDDCDLQSFGFLDFSSTHLKELIIVFLEDWTDISNFQIKVSCPNLISFKYSGLNAMNYILENVSSLETVWIDFCNIFGEYHEAGHVVHSMLKQVQNVTNLHCHMNVIWTLCRVIDELIRCSISFPKVKFLSVFIVTINYQARVLFHLLDHCPNLEFLTLVSEPFDGEWVDEYRYEGIVSWKSHPYLKTIKFVDFTGSEHELDFLKFLLKNSKSLERMDIIRDGCYKISEEVIDELLVFPKASPGIVVTFIDP